MSGLWRKLIGQTIKQRTNQILCLLAVIMINHDINFIAELNIVRKTHVRIRKHRKLTFLTQTEKSATIFLILRLKCSSRKLSNRGLLYWPSLLRRKIMTLRTEHDVRFRDMSKEHGVDVTS